MVENDSSLTPAQEAFATGLASGLSQAEAYRRAYPAALKWKDESVWQRASKLAADAKVQSRVQDLLGKAAAANEVGVERVLREIVRMSMFDPADLVNVKGPADIPHLPEDVRRAIVGWSWDKHGNFVLKLAKEGSLGLLARCLGMLTDRTELTGKDGKDLIPAGLDHFYGGSKP